MHTLNLVFTLSCICLFSSYYVNNEFGGEGPESFMLFFFIFCLACSFNKEDK